MLKRILVGLSGTQFTPVAVRYATELARAHDAAVTGVTIMDLKKLEDVGPVPMGGGAAAHALAEHRLQVTGERVESACADFERLCVDGGINHQVVRETGDLMDSLCDLWRYHDLTIFGLRGLFEYGVLRNPDDEVIRLLGRGVRPIVAVSEEHRPIRHVLVAYNGSMESAKAMKRFVQMRLWPDVTLQIVCFYKHRDVAVKLLEDAAGYCRAHGFQTDTEAVEGSPVDELLDYAGSCGADMIALGTSDRHKLRKLVLGDVVTAAIRNSELPLFLAR
ncbi:MAG: universal stress protein [Planctomycetota bacterium]|jgi:nucleotide-binding universal stress UspA family protein